MTDTTREIFDKYQIRKTKKQKTAFISYVEKLCEDWKLPCRIEKGALGTRNIVVGDIESAKVVYTAHYDTCPVLPFPNFITPKSFLIYLLYQLVIVIAFIGVTGILDTITGIVGGIIGWGSYITLLVVETIYILLLVLMVVGPANTHTANDNTSGVTLLIDIMRELPEDKRNSVAFVFFDLEEVGLVGSAVFAEAHKKVMKNKLLINFDCVSDGDNLLFSVKKGAKDHEIAIKSAFEEKDGFKVEVADKGVFYPSDQMNFPCGVGVAALLSTKDGLLYMDKIHTKKDTVYREENIEFLKNGAIELPKLL